MKKEIQVTYVGENYAFAITQDDFQQAYIPNSILTQMADVEVGDLFDATLVDNDRDPRGRTPWFVTHAVVHLKKSDADEISDAVRAKIDWATLIERISPTTTPFAPDPRVPDEDEKIDLFSWDPFAETPSMGDKVRAALDEMGDRPFRTSEMAKALGISSKRAGSLMHMIFKQNLVSVAKIYDRPDQVSASWSLWCKNVSGFLK
jgi:hypothetical protein